MDKYTFTQVDKKQYGIYHAIYSDCNIFMRLDWNERMNVLKSNENGYFVFLKDKLVGGFSLLDNQISNPFMFPPFIDRLLFWKIVLDYASEICCKDELYLSNISKADVEILTEQFSATIKMTQRIMLRPTEQSDVGLKGNFYFTELLENDIPYIVQTVFTAHSTGYTSKSKTPDKEEIEKAINMRFQAFSQTKTLHLSTLVKSIDNHELVGVCIAGIYPDSPNNFSTIHQVSVLPEFRKRGIAESMMLRTINTAHTISPVITLGVMVGNPAEQLYNKLGFTSGPSYCNLIYTVQ
ncbi:GNAT family N-acetyltransferase [Lachnoclostridium sp.]|uniref:GNAT family N-acetyltransferase n=1 Tax=Lachnoclostridium sp. TaxID=2028282 RepID=UPI00289751E6|nr:GNAT family N-acetyltransferase [Lachnoclostridium sp.]